MVRPGVEGLCDVRRERRWKDGTRVRTSRVQEQVGG